MNDDTTPHLGAMLESLPDAVVAALEVRDAWRRRVADSNPGLEFIVSDLQSWPVGSTVRVGFLDGDSALHAAVVSATTQISEAMNLTLDFGYDDAAGTYRRWSLDDQERQAEVRVSFDMGGYWSLVGTDATDTTIDPWGGPIGGLPGQRTLNLGGYKDGLPAGWEGTVRHEFLHALAFQHEHQNMRGPCEDDFRWEDDEDYVPTTDARGVFVKDAAGRSPGIYTYLAGPPNRWSRQKVDHNLRTSDDPGTIASTFDAASVMLYRFAPFFYLSDPSPCAPTGNGEDLSDGDKRGLGVLYPPVALPEVVEQARQGLQMLTTEAPGAGVGRSPYSDRVVDLLDARIAAADG